MNLPVVWVGISLAGCTVSDVPDVPETSETVQEIGRTQGTKFQGTKFQGTKFQGTRYDGGDWLYTGLSNVTWGTTPVVDAEISKATLMFWREFKILLNGTWRTLSWERRGPRSICSYDPDRNQTGCTTLTSFSAGNPSPIAGTRYRGRFREADGTQFDATIQIGLSTTDHTAVAFDNSSAMHRLNNHGNGTCESYLEGATMADGTKCQNAGGCRKNCDLWLYKIYLVDPAVDNGVPYAACGGSGYAIAVPGVYTGNGTRGDDPLPGDKHTQFTFSCLEGTIAKCTQWGYRPWGSATKTCQTEPCGKAPLAVPLVDLHQSCIRAAMADYCTNGTSYTRPGTVVDVWDYEHRVARKWGFVARTNPPPVPSVSNSAFVFESKFDKHGMYIVDHTRYEEATGQPDTETIQGCNMVPVCGPGGACDGTDGWTRPSGPLTQYHAESAISIDSTTACAHSEFTTGKWLHKDCSPCTRRIAQFGGYERCTTPIGWSPIDSEIEGVWDESCVQLARDRCAMEAWERPQSIDPFYAIQMASHSECTAGAALNSLDTGCTWRVCSGTPSCCTSSWSSTCVGLANHYCYGGEEQGNTGFCGNPIGLELPTQPINWP